MSEINTTLNDVYKSTVLGDHQRAMGLALYGLNHRQTPQAIPINRDMHGYIFFTRPQLNMTDQNLRAERKFAPLMDRNSLSIPRYIRRMLDPRLPPERYPCPVADDKQAFIPLLTNLCTTCSGWPDPTLDMYTSRPGVQKEVFQYIDSEINNYGSYDLSVTFRNMPGDPITAMIDYWMLYSSRVFEGMMVPYPDMIALNEVDHQTRVWRLVMDKSKRFVQKIGCTGVSVPRSNPMGAAFNFDSNKPLNQGADELQFTFPSVGFCYNDPILVAEFNEVVAIFNPDMRALAAGQQPQEHVRVEPADLQLLNSDGYPYIHPDTMELSWYLPTTAYNARVSGILRNAQALGIAVP